MVAAYTAMHNSRVFLFKMNMSELATQSLHNEKRIRTLLFIN